VSAAPRTAAGRTTSVRTAAARVVTAMATGLAAALAAGLSVAQPAAADTAPPVLSPATPATVSADPLPTVQINGVVWSQVIIGTTVYATGNFSSARPAGSPTGTNETPRANLLAYDIRTGTLNTSFHHTLNAQGLTLAASPDGTRLYVGGDFTTIDSQPRNRIAAFDTTTGTLIADFHPTVTNRVRALAATNTTVYLGGDFTSVDGAARSRLAATAATGGRLLSWAPAAGDQPVRALLIAPAGDRVIVGGNFTTIDGVRVDGSASLDAVTGALLPWAVNATVRNSGLNSGITSLRTDGRLIYATVYTYVATGQPMAGNLEGSFAAEPNTGRMVWLEDCHGDTYDSVALGGVVYVAGHPYYCGNVGGFPDTYPNRIPRRAIAFSAAATGTVQTNTHDTFKTNNWGGQPAPTLQTWFPSIAAGTFTGQFQGAWSTTGSGAYLAFGGEFPRVNGVAQQGLVRFALPGLAPNRVGPAPAPDRLRPKLVSLAQGTVRVSWTSTADRDNLGLTYSVIRDGQLATPVRTSTIAAPDWDPATTGFTDTGLVPGSTHTYQVRVRDPFGNTTTGPAASVTVSATVPGGYPRAVQAGAPTHYWRLGEAAAATGYDHAGVNDLVLGGGTVRGIPGALRDPGADGDAATGFDGSPAGLAVASLPERATDSFSAQAWFRTTSTAGGTLIGFGAATSGSSRVHDRQVYLDAAGRVRFGVFNTQVHTVAGPTAYNDGRWHQVVATLGGAGLVLFVDGRQVATDPATALAKVYSGYWHIGSLTLSGWPNKPASPNLAADIDEVAVYPTQLNGDAVASQYAAAGYGAFQPAALSDPYGAAVSADHPQLYWRLDEPGSAHTAADASGHDNVAAYVGRAVPGVPSPVTGPPSAGLAGTGVGLVPGAKVVATAATRDPQRFSLEAWFATTTTTGGRIVGFGSAPSGSSRHYDRQLWMLDDGRLTFATYTTQTNRVITSARYNDGAWHHVVATLGTDGLTLWVDGARVGANPTPGAEHYTGYWRIGQDRVPGGASTPGFTGSVDEVAVYPSVLPAARVLAHFQASPVAHPAVR